MAQVNILSKAEIASLLDMKSVVESVEQAYMFKRSGKAELFPIVTHSFDVESEMDIKSGSVDGAGIFGLKLVSAFAGYEHTMNAYKVAVEEKYRFFSFGDAMFIA